MIEFVNFSITIPYPSIEVILLYWIIGSLVYVGVMWRDAICNVFHLSQRDKWWTPCAVQVVVVMMWPYALHALVTGNMD